MREQREPWLKLPEKDAGRDETPRIGPRFRTHVVTVRAAGAMPATLPAQIPDRPLTAPPARDPVLPLPAVGTAPAAPARQAAIVQLRAAAPSLIPARAEPVPPATPRPAQAHAPSAAEIGLADLADVSSADWLTKVGEAARVVDVVVVFYSEASLGSAVFPRAFRTVVNETLPRLGRPYAVYRFSLDAEPGFVADMAESLGLAEADPITTAGFAWSGPGRRLFLIGDRALESQAAFQRALRQNLRGERAPAVDERGARRAGAGTLERPRPGAVQSHAPIWRGRVLVILGWCLFGTVAMAAAVVGVAPHWANSLLHPVSLPGSGTAADGPAGAATAQDAATAPPATIPDIAPAAPVAAGAQELTKSAKPVRHAKRKQTPSWVTLNPGYWGLPEKAVH